MVLPGISMAFAFSFLLAAGDFVVPTLVGGTQGVMIGNVITDQFRGVGADWPLGAGVHLRHHGASCSPSIRASCAADPLGDAMVGRPAHRCSPAAYVAVVLVCLFSPIAVIVLFSFVDLATALLPIEGLTLDWYAAALSQSLLHGARQQHHPRGRDRGRRRRDRRSFSFGVSS